MFRGLNKAGTLNELQNRLRQNSAVTIIPELEQAEARLTVEWQREDHEAREKEWQSSVSNEDKASVDPARFLKEYFQNRRHNVVVLQIGHHGPVHDAAKLLGFEAFPTDAPMTGTSPATSGGSSTRWLVVGRTRSALFKKVAEVNAQVEKNKPSNTKQQNAMASAQKRKTELMSKSTSKSMGKPHQIRSTPQTLSRSPKSSEGFKVEGTWNVQCPYVEENWGRSFGGDRCSMTIYVEPVKNNNNVQMWATFDFIVLTGVMRFLAPVQGPATESKGQAVTAGSKRKREDDWDADEGDDRYPNRFRPEFSFPPASLPSAANPSLPFIWRGEETGEGEIQLYSNRLKGCMITFGGPEGTEMNGTFNGSIVGKIQFSGMKWQRTKLTARKSASTRGPTNASQPDFRSRPSLASAGYEQQPPLKCLDIEWSGRSEEAYEYARVNRWR